LDQEPTPIEGGFNRREIRNSGKCHAETYQWMTLSLRP